MSKIESDISSVVNLYLLAYIFRIPLLLFSSLFLASSPLRGLPLIPGLVSSPLLSSFHIPGLEYGDNSERIGGEYGEIIRRFWKEEYAETMVRGDYGKIAKRIRTRREYREITGRLQREHGKKDYGEISREFRKNTERIRGEYGKTTERLWGDYGENAKRIRRGQKLHSYIDKPIPELKFQTSFQEAGCWDVGRVQEEWLRKTHPHTRHRWVPCHALRHIPVRVKARLLSLLGST